MSYVMMRGYGAEPGDVEITPVVAPTSHRAPAATAIPDTTSVRRETQLTKTSPEACADMGGVYNPRTGTCSVSPYRSPRGELSTQEGGGEGQQSPEQACAAAGGTWNIRSQACDMNPYDNQTGGGAGAGVGVVAMTGAAALAALLLLR